MKKLGLFIFIFVISFFMFGCKTEEDAFKKYKDEMINYLRVDAPEDVVTSQMDLSDYFEFSDGEWANVTWSTSDSNYIRDDGRFRSNTIGKYITLHADVDSSVGMFDFDYVVYAKGYMSAEEYLEEVAKLIPDNIYTDIEFQTVEEEILKAKNVKSTISYKSLNEDVLSSDGKYLNRDSKDKTIKIEYTVKSKDFELSGTCTRVVLGRHDEEIVAYGANWISAYFDEHDYAKDDIYLPSTDDVGKVKFEYVSLNQDIYDNEGTVVNLSLDKTVEFAVTIKMNDYFETANVKVKTLKSEDKIEYILDRMHQDEITQSYFKTYVRSSSAGTKFDDFGFLNFFVKDISEKDLILKGTEDTGYTYGTNDYNDGVEYKEILHYIVPTTSVNRPGYTKQSINFICIHDTGDDYYDAIGWSGQITTDDREVSWHFTIDDTNICQHLPLTEVAWHAGDGSNRFGLTNSGVKYTVKNPTLEFKNGYLYINGEKSLLKSIYYDGKEQTAITPAGIYTERGSDGNYYVNNYYYSKSYGVIANGGGNYNSIGIETCIVDYTRYSETMRNTANLVAHMLTMYGLNPSRVLQHRNFSGKLCPQSMIRNGTYDYFMEMIEIEYFILNNQDGAKWTYTSNNPDLVANDGKISKYVTEDTEVSYTVKVEYNGETVEKTYKTVIKPIA